MTNWVAPKLVDLAGIDRNVQSYKTGQQQIKMNNLKLSSAQRGAEKEGALFKLLEGADLTTSQGRKATAVEATRIDPNFGLDFQKKIQGLDEVGKDRAMKEAGLASEAFTFLKGHPNPETAYGVVRDYLAFTGVDPAKIPEQYDPKKVEMLQHMAQETMKLGKPRAAVGPDGNNVFVQPDGQGNMVPMNGGFAPPKKAPLVSMGGEQQSAMQKELGKKFAGDYADTQNKSVSAQGTVAALDELSGLLDQGVQTGFGQDFLTGARNFGLRLGVDVNQSQLQGSELFAALSNRMIGPLVKQLGQNPTDKDLQFIVQAAPTLSKTVEGNKLIINALKRQSMREMKLAAAQDQFYQTNGTLQGFAQEASQLIAEMPLFSDEERSQMYGLSQSAPQQYSHVGGPQEVEPLPGQPGRREALREALRLKKTQGVGRTGADKLIGPRYQRY